MPATFTTINKGIVVIDIDAISTVTMYPKFTRLLTVWGEVIDITDPFEKVCNDVMAWINTAPIGIDEIVSDLETCVRIV